MPHLKASRQQLRGLRSQLLLRQSGAHHIDHIEADERLEQANVRLGQGVAGEVALLAQGLLAAVQRRKQLPAITWTLSQTLLWVPCRDDH